jgi:hypothetical protein
MHVSAQQVLTCTQKPFPYKYCDPLTGETYWYCADNPHIDHPEYILMKWAQGQSIGFVYNASLDAGCSIDRVELDNCLNNVMLTWSSLCPANTLTAFRDQTGFNRCVRIVNSSNPAEFNSDVRETAAETE